MTKLNATLTSVAMQSNSRAESKWLFDFDIDSPLMVLQFYNDLPVDGTIYKTLGTNNAVYLSFELFENSIKVSGARFEILVSTSDVTFDKVNYNSVYILVSKSCEFDLTIKTVDGEISKTIRVVVS